MKICLFLLALCPALVERTGKIKFTDINYADPKPGTVAKNDEKESIVDSQEPKSTQP